MSTLKLRARELLAQREGQLDRRIRLQELAAETGIAPDTLAQLLNNQVTHVALSDLAALCRWFGVGPGDLLAWVVDDQPLEVDARDVVEHWEQTYGHDRHEKGPAHS